MAGASGRALRLLLALTLTLTITVAPYAALAVSANWPGRAKAAAVATWGDLCGGTVTFRAAPIEHSAHARWTGWRWEPARNCVVTFNSSELARMTYGEFCSLTIHEYGHFAWRVHSPNPRSIMHTPIRITHKRCR